METKDNNSIRKITVISVYQRILIIETEGL